MIDLFGPLPERLELFCTQPCEEPFCGRDGIECWLEYDAGAGDGQEDCILCPEHAREAGYCKGCGQFWGGIESFDFGSGYCDNCEFQIRSEIEWGDEPYDDDDDY